MTKSRSPLRTTWPSWNAIAVNVPPTCARIAMVSTAENWPRKLVVATIVFRRGRLTVTCGGGGGGGTCLLPNYPDPAPPPAAITGREPSPTNAIRHPLRGPGLPPAADRAAQLGVFPVL